MREDVWSHYGNWWAVALWILMFGAFLFFVPFYRKADRKPAGAFLAFIVAFALEMFGLPLSLYFVMWAFGKTLPEGLLWGHTLINRIGMTGHYLYLASLALGGTLIVAGWSRIHRDYWSKEEGQGRLVVDGLYRFVRHPQYAGFLLISLGVLCEWSTLPLLILWPILPILYTRLAKREEAEMELRFGEEWRRYAARTGRFLPRCGRRAAPMGLVFTILLLLSPIRALSAEGLSWNSYAEAGLGISLAGDRARPTLSLDGGFLLGDLELGSYLAILPLEFGNPDLIQAGAVHYGGTIGTTLGGADSAFRPFGRLALGGVARERADDQGGFDGRTAEKSFSSSLVIGIELPLGGPWSARAWGSYRFAPGAEDFEGGSLSGPDFGLSLRACWETRIR